MRYLSLCIKRMFLAFLTEIISFQKLLKVVNRNKFREYTMLLFHNYSRLWSTYYLSNMLSWETETALSLYITVSFWQQIIIIINQELIQHWYSVEDLTAVQMTNYILQAEYSKNIKSHYYILSADILCEIDIKTLTVFCKILTV